MSFSWPDGSLALEHITCTFPAARSGPMGANGTGKSTLLRLIEGGLRPESGAIHAHGRVGRLRQQLVPDARATVADLLGSSGVRTALRRIETESLDPHDFDLVGGNWDVDARALAVLAQLGLAGDDDLLERPAATLSGGQATQVALAGVRLAGWDVTLLDEPTNNLDLGSVDQLVQALDGYGGALLVLTHDEYLARELRVQREWRVTPSRHGIEVLDQPA